MLAMILYAFLGVALAASGINVIDKPWQFCVIMMLVMAIDLSSKFGK